MVTAQYRRRDPEQSLLHRIVRENLETFFAAAHARSPDGRGLPRYVRGAFERYLDCGILAKGFVRVHCPDCGYDTVVGFSCKDCPRKLRIHIPRLKILPAPSAREGLERVLIPE